MTTVADARAVLGSHEDDLAVCVHGWDPDPILDYVTVLGMVADLAGGVLHAAPGNPCVTPFETFEVSALLAEARAT